MHRQDYNERTKQWVSVSYMFIINILSDVLSIIQARVMCLLLCLFISLSCLGQVTKIALLWTLAS